METVKITKIFISDKAKPKDGEKEGKPFVTKTGKPFWKIGILCDKYPNDWLSALAFAQDDPEMQLQEGDEVKIVIETNGQYKNFKLPTRLDQLEEQINELMDWKRSITSVYNPVEKAPEIDDSDLPF